MSCRDRLRSIRTATRWPLRNMPQAYEEQRQRLQVRLLATGQAEELFVAKVFAVQRPDGGAHTYTTWTEGVKTLLPSLGHTRGSGGWAGHARVLLSGRGRLARGCK